LRFGRLSRHNLPTLHMAWWFWIVLGLALSALELATPGGIVIVFFGIGALAVGLLALAGVAGPAWVQWLLFPAFALASLRLFRPRILNRLGIGSARSDVDSLVGQVALAAEVIAPGAHGRAELRGTTWSARNVDSISLSAGQRCRVVAVQGLMLDLRSE
jgi:membrane protein implicated in regulation of membrane protease activity